VKVYTRTGDDGTTGLFYGGRVSKAGLGPEAYGTVDEAVSTLGLARAYAVGELNEEILSLQRQLFVVAAELATDPANRHKLVPAISLTTEQMILDLEASLDRLIADVGAPDGFMVPGESPLSAHLDLARAVIRRAERRCVAYADAGQLDGSFVVPFLNRLADYVFMLVRASETNWQPSKQEKL